MAAHPSTLAWRIPWTEQPRKKIVIAMDYNTMILKNPHNTQFYFLSEVRRIKGKLNRNGSYHM